MEYLSTTPIWDPTDRQALSPGIKTALKRFHVNLGHPTNDDLRHLRGPKGSEMYAVFHLRKAVDQHTDFSAIAPCPSRESQAVAKKIFKHWTRLAKPPDALVCDGERGLGASEIFTEKLSVSWTPVQTTAAFSPWQKGRVEQRIATIKEVAGKTLLQHQVAARSAMSVVSCEVAHTLNLKAGRLGILPATRVFGQRMKVYVELMEHGEVVLHPKVMDEGDELARLFIIQTSAREALEEHALLKRS